MSKKWRVTELLFILVVAVLIAYQLFVPPIVGLSDSGDFSRMMRWVGIDYLDGDGNASRDLFMIRTWGFHFRLEPHYPSSELAMLGAALAVDMVATGDDGVFDIRSQGLANAVAFLLALVLFASYARTFTVGRRLLFYGLIALIFTDVGYVAYFNSFYSEPASLIFLSGALGVALLLTAYGETGRRSKLWLAAYFVLSALFVLAKVQNALMGIPLAYIGYRLYGVTGPAKRRVRFKMWATGLTVGLVLVSFAYYGASSMLAKKMVYQNMYKTVFHEILGHSDDPASDAAALGVDPAWLYLAGTIPGERPEPSGLHDFLMTRMGYGRVLRFYLTHPGSLISLSDRCCNQGFTLRPTYLGNYERDYFLSSGGIELVPMLHLPQEYFSKKCALWSDLKALVVPKSIWTLFAFILANVLALVVKTRRYDHDHRDRMITELHAVVVIMALIQFFTSIVGEGDYDIVKHLFLFNLLCEVSFVFLVSYTYCALAGLKRKKSVAQPEMVAVNDR